MERAAWTDERLDDLSRRMDAGFDRVDAQFDRVDAQFDRVDAQFDRVHTDIRDVRGEIALLRTTMLRVGGVMVGAMLTGFLGVIAAVFAGA